MSGEEGGSRSDIWDFPGSPVVKTLPSNAGGADLVPGWGTKTPQHKTSNILTNSTNTIIK